MKRNSKTIRDKKTRERNGDSFERKKRKREKQQNRQRRSDKFEYDDYIDYDELNKNEDF